MQKQYSIQESSFLDCFRSLSSKKTSFNLMSKTDYGSNYFQDRWFSRNEKSYQDDLNFLRKYIDPSLSILDYGCGEMRFTHFLKDYFSNVSVYDISYIQSLDAYTNIFNPIFSSCKYDVIVLRGVLQHLDQPFLC